MSPCGAQFPDQASGKGMLTLVYRFSLSTSAADMLVHRTMRTSRKTPERVAKVAPAELSLLLRRKLAVEEAEDGPAAVFEAL